MFFLGKKKEEINNNAINFLLDKVFRSENVKVEVMNTGYNEEIKIIINGKLLEMNDNNFGYNLGKLVALATPFVDVLKNGGFFIVDNFADGLHPMVVNFLVECFKRKDINTGGGTLIFSSHNYDIVDVLDYDNIFTVSKAYGESYIENVTPQPNKEKFKKELRYGYYGGQCEITSLDFFAKELEELSEGPLK